MHCFYCGLTPADSVGIKYAGMELTACISGHPLATIIIPKIRELTINPIADYADQRSADNTAEMLAALDGLEWDADKCMPICQSCNENTPLDSIQNWRGFFMCDDCASNAEFA